MESTIGCVESSLSAIDRDSGDTVSDAPTADGYCTFQSIDISTLQLEKLCLDGEMESGDVMVVEEESEKGDVFLYLELPEDIHRLLFKKHLSTADRLRARVTTGLVKIEAEERYDYVRLNIVDDVNYKMNSCCIKNIDCVNMILTKSSEIYMDGLHKIASNSTFEHIVFDLDGPAYGDLLPVVAGIPSSRLTVSIEASNESLSRDLLTEDRLVQLADGRESVSIRKTVPSLTTDVLRRFYQMMETGDGTVNEYCFYSVPSSIGREFYCSLGLCFSCHCTNRQIHGVYHGACFIFVLIGRCVIYFSEELFEGEEGGMINIQRFNDDGESPGAHFIIPKRTIEELCNIPITYIDGGHVHGEEEEDEEEEEEEGEENEDEEELSDDGWVEEEDTADEEEEGEE